jgi:2-haloacid dehalogenase
LGGKAEDALFVAGSSGDVVGAAEAGMKVVWNNHVGLTAKLGSHPLREGKSLDEALADFL